MPTWLESGPAPSQGDPGRRDGRRGSPGRVRDAWDRHGAEDRFGRDSFGAGSDRDGDHDLSEDHDWDGDHDRNWDLDNRRGHPARRRWAPAPPAAIALIVVGIVACVIAGVRVFGGDDEIGTVAFPVQAGPTGSSAAGPSTAGQSTRPRPGHESATPSGEIVVSVVGLVQRPGLVRLRSQARVADALDRAGGARPGADTLSLNLAQPLRDGDQVLVGVAAARGGMGMRSAVVSAGGSAGAAPADGPPASAASGTGGAPTGGKVDLNSATEAQLDELPGVGPVTAAAIIEWRARNGRFASVDQLGEVNGIGPARLARLRDLVTV
nr:ComEA family DNA-binding protein [Gordonia soli]